MSCLAPISVPDKILRKFGISDHQLLVPCGHCAGCARDRRNDWFVRLWTVYHSYRRKRLPVWFVTVTIDQRLWPGMTVSSPGVGDRISPFIRSWNERLRYLNNGKMPLRFLCSEFGSSGRDYVDKYGVVRVTTGALHFHGLLFGKLDVSRIGYGFRLTHGYVDFDLVRGPEAIRYIVKYCTKDFSVDDPSLRARTFCSPGLGDSSFYFGSSSPTPIVMINGFHYRCPRYLVDKQWLSIYGKDAFTNSISSSILVDARCMARVALIHRELSRAESAFRADPSLRDYLRFCYERDMRRPASIDQVLSLYDQGLVGCSHPLIRYYQKRIFDIDYRNSLSFDRSFFDSFNCLFYYTNQFNSFSYEGHQTFIPLSFDIST